MIMGTEGPIMSGTWVNPQTGHKFTVRDCFFENDQFRVQTTDGQLLDYNTIQNYIQCTDDKGNEVTDIPMMPPTVPDDITSMLTPEDAAAIKGLGNLNDNSRHFAPSAEHSAPQINYAQIVDNHSEDYKMIDRVLRRHNIPQINAVIEWAVPRKQIETLVDILGVDPEEIASYYCDKLDMTAISLMIHTRLNEYIESLLPQGVETAASTDPEPLEVEDGPKPKTTKQTKPTPKKIKK